MKTIDTTDCPCRTDPNRNDPNYRAPKDVIVGGSKLRGPYLFRTTLSV